MRIVFAAGQAGDYWADVFEDVLVSFADDVVRKRPLLNSFWFLDSGAYSFWQGGLDGTAKLAEYITFLQTGPGAGHRRYAVMDVIRDPEGTWANDKVMRAEGLNPIACVHFGEPYRTIDRYLDAGVEAIALGGYAGSGASVKEARVWFDAIFARIAAAMKSGAPLPKMHGFGVAHEHMLLNYPFYSVDSTVWLVSRRYGEVLSWNPHTGRMEQNNPKYFADAGALKMERDIPLAVADGYLQPDARDYKAAWNIVQTLELADWVTKVWEDRGIRWEDEPERVKSAIAQREFLLAKWPEVISRAKGWSKREHPWSVNA